MVIEMGILNNLKQNLKREINAIKYDRKLMNDPDVVRSRLDAERNEIKIQKQKLINQRQLEMDRDELRSLRNSTGVRGKLKNGLTALRGQLDNVKKRNEASDKFKLRSTKNTPRSVGSASGNIPSSSVFELKSTKGIHDSVGSYKPFGSGGVLGESPKKKPKKKSSGQTIVIKVGK